MLLLIVTYLIVMTHPSSAVSHSTTGNGLNRKYDTGSNNRLAASDLSNHINVTMLVIQDGREDEWDNDVTW